MIVNPIVVDTRAEVWSETMHGQWNDDLAGNAGRRVWPVRRNQEVNAAVAAQMLGYQLICASCPLRSQVKYTEFFRVSGQLRGSNGRLWRWNTALVQVSAWDVTETG